MEEKDAWCRVVRAQKHIIDMEGLTFLAVLRAKWIWRRLRPWPCICILEQVDVAVMPKWLRPRFCSLVFCAAALELLLISIVWLWKMPVSTFQVASRSVRSGIRKILSPDGARACDKTVFRDSSLLPRRINNVTEEAQPQATTTPVTTASHVTSRSEADIMKNCCHNE